MKRKLASIQEVTQLAPIKKADRIEVATVLGWEIVVKKGEFNIGDKCVYIEVDGFLPVDDERFEFLRPTSYKRNDLVGEGFRVRSIEMRNQISQGLLFQLSNFSELSPELPIGEDVTKLLKIRKFEEPEQNTGIGTTIGAFSPYVSTTDEMRIQSIPGMIEELTGKPYYISTKMDGTSSTIEVVDGVVHAYNRYHEMKDEEKSVLWKWIHKHKIDEKMTELGIDFSIQGELCGPGIQKNRLQLREHEVFIYNVNDSKGKRQSLNSLIKMAALLKIKTVPIDEVGESFDYTLEELKEKSKGYYPSGIRREGIVVRPQEPFKSEEGLSSLSFKVLNNEFLLKVEN